MMSQALFGRIVFLPRLRVRGIHGGQRIQHTRALLREGAFDRDELSPRMHEAIRHDRVELPWIVPRERIAHLQGRRMIRRALA